MRKMHLGFFPSRRAGLLAGLAVAALLSGAAASLGAQQTPAGTAPAASTPGVTGSSDTTTDAQGRTTQSATLSVDTGKKKKADKPDRVQQTKDTRAAIRKDKKFNPLIGKDADLPDKQLYDKAMDQIQHGHFDVGRLDLQTLLNTYPDSQYMMRSKLAVADAWYREGGSAALAQAEQEYNDFITFFPNAPEASEAQMRVGDIYFKQIDATDRDYTKVLKAEEAYRLMLKTYPDAPAKLLSQAKQDLREVQELLAEREAQLGSFYAGHLNWAASIARYQTVVDTYPQYSHMDDVLIGIGDAYSAQARTLRTQPACGTVATNVPCIPEASKARLLDTYDSKAAAEYRKVVLEHAAAPHVEDAKERLIDMGMPVPTPTAEQVAASDVLEGSRAQYTMSKRLELLFLRKPDTVVAARTGEPLLDDPPPTTAPAILDISKREYVAALNPAGAPSAPAAPATAAEAPAAPDQPVPPAAPVGNAPLALGDVPGPGGSTAASDTTTVTNTSGGSGGTTTSLGVEIVTPGAGVSTRASDIPSATGAPDATFGLKSTGAPTVALPAPEAAQAAPDQVNEAAGMKQTAAAVPPADAGGKKKKNPKPVYDKYDESSSKHKPKKGAAKVNPF